MILCRKGHGEPREDSRLGSLIVKRGQDPGVGEARLPPFPKQETPQGF